MSGCEWIIDAHGCNASTLADLGALQALFSHLITGMGLRPVEAPVFHQFPDPGGITGLTLLAESHIACHTFPEFGSLCLNVFCCVPRSPCSFEQYLKDRFGASRVHIQQIHRPYGAAGAHE